MKARFFTILIMVGLLTLFSASAIAQEATPQAAASQSTELTYGTPVEGEITDQIFEQVWTLTTASADRVRVRVERLDGTLIPDLFIRDSNGQDLAQSFGAEQDYATAQIHDTTLPSAGTFQVVVSRERGADGLTEGRYTLVVLPLATAEDNPLNTAVVGTVEYNTPITGEITATRWYSRYTLTTEAVDVIRVSVRRISGSFSPEIDVLDVNGTEIARGFTSSTEDTAEIDSYELPGAGTYTVAVTRGQRFREDGVGSFELTVTLLGAGEGSSLLSGFAGEVEYNTVLTGQLSGGRWYEDWQLTTTAADSITLSVQRVDDPTGGNLQPEIYLFGGSGQELRRSFYDNSTGGSSIDYDFDVPGSYIVRVARSQGVRGQSTGAYELVVTLRGTGEDDPALEDVVGTMTLGEPLTGELSNARWRNVWTFQGEADHVIDVVVERASGTLSPRVELQDSNGQSLRSVYPDETRAYAIIEDFRITATGEFRVVVFREGERTGATTGAYRVTVLPSEND